MARLFDDASTQYLENSTAIVAGDIYTVSAWAYFDDLTVPVAIFSMSANNTGGGQSALAMDGSNILGKGDNTVHCFRRISSGGINTITAWSSSAVSVNTWHHVCGVWNGLSDRQVYLDGVAGTQNTATANGEAPIKTTIGRLGDTTPNWEMSGSLAEVSVWNVALTAAEVLSLSKGHPPNRIRAKGLKSYTRLHRGNNRDMISGKLFTPFNTPTNIAHPRVIYPIYPRHYPARRKAPAVGGLAIPIAYHYRQQMNQ